MQVCADTLLSGATQLFTLDIGASSHSKPLDSEVNQSVFRRLNELLTNSKFFSESQRFGHFIDSSILMPLLRKA
ncbi:MAG: hypothetical protein LBU65_00350 [Planctomycetaceae bacterium]|nr:hypothetical protein [Planctomycetaceae bacterium]